MASSHSTIRYVAAVVFIGAAIAASASAVAAQESEREKALRELGKDLAEINQQLIQASGRAPLGAAVVVPTKPSVPVKAGAADSSQRLFTITQGQEYPILDKVGSWYAIEADGGRQGWVNAANVVPKAAPASPMTGPVDWAVSKAVELRTRYQNNPYVSVTGFGVTLGLPPSLTINCDFK
jgi:uncharacterized protein YgiM (DUF1202 family)